MTTDIAALTANDIDKMDTETLRGYLAQALTITARTLYQMGLIWRELESRGEDLSDLRSGLAVFLPLIASRRLRAEAVVRWAGKSMLLRRIAELPLSEQDKLLELENVEIVNNDGSVRSAPLSALTTKEIARVISTHGLRSVDQQCQYIRSMPEVVAAKRAAIDTTLNIDTSGRLRSGRLIVKAHGEAITVNALEQALARYRAGQETERA